jgi:hypothetical protein
MRCANCGAELGSNEQECANCRKEELEIKVLTPEEKRDFHGITIDQSGQSQSQERLQYEGSGERMYVRHASVSLPKAGLFVKLLIGAGLLFVAMAALSAVSFLVVLGCIVWFVLRMFR